MGIRESRDVESVLDFLHKTGHRALGLWGRSAGAAASLLASSRRDALVDAVIVDSCFLSLEQVSREIAGGHIKSQMNITGLLGGQPESPHGPLLDPLLGQNLLARSLARTADRLARSARSLGPPTARLARLARTADRSFARLARLARRPSTPKLHENVLIHRWSSCSHLNFVQRESTPRMWPACLHGKNGLKLRLVHHGG
jgi:pimeloyl-ACP methyl ester carboxylesterase